MAAHHPVFVRNHLLAALALDDFDFLMPKLERIPLKLEAVLIEAHQPIAHVVFPESGMVSTVTDTDKGRIEMGLIGREGLSGVPVILGTSQTPHTYVVQGSGEGFRIGTQELCDAIRERPSLLRPLGLFAQSLIVQMAQTIYATSTCTLDVRLARWILLTHDRAEGDDLQLTHEFLAAMLGVRRAGVTEATHALESLDLIRNNRGHIEVRNRDKLLDMAGDAYRVGRTETDRLAAEGWNAGDIAFADQPRMWSIQPTRATPA